MKFLRSLKIAPKRFRQKRNLQIGPVVGSAAISMVRNEQDIIEPFVRHNSALVDLLFVLDNCSTDHTRQILREL
ncbi:MAG: glycosyltransferase family 2 protein, partial [Alphaproteobacteria bacterium]|nr:glycosyltransferase family 2 protein [Alphaproteobacteria bacterium]